MNNTNTNAFPYFVIHHNGEERCPDDAIDIRGPYETAAEARESAENWAWEYGLGKGTAEWAHEHLFTDMECQYWHIAMPTSK